MGSCSKIGQAVDNPVTHVHFVAAKTHSEYVIFTDFQLHLL